jgi:hypothetical protein
MKPILILDAFIGNEDDEKILHRFIDSAKTIEDDILLMSNTKISKTIQDKVDYFFYDKRNQLFVEEYDNYGYVSYYTQYGNFQVSDVSLRTQPHGLSVLISLFRSVKIAKDLGYTHFYKMEYDAVLGDETKSKIKSINESCLSGDKKGVFFVINNEYYNGVEAHYFLCEIDYFLNNFWNVASEKDYINFLQTKKNNKNFLLMERFMHENLIELDSNIVQIRYDFHEYFSDTIWDTKQSRVYIDEKYKKCYTKFYIDEDDDNKVVVYSKNFTNSSTIRKIIVRFNDGSETEVLHHFAGYLDWNLHSFEKNIEKMTVYDEDGFLYEEYFQNVLNVYEGDGWYQENAKNKNLDFLCKDYPIKKDVLNSWDM